MSTRKLPSRIIDSSQYLESQGLKFPGTQVPSADPNTLDDYEEGTWTPTISEHSRATSVTYSDRKGWYVKTGRNLTLGAVINVTTHDGSTSHVSWQINGFPFVGDSFYGEAGSFSVYNNATGYVVGGGRTNGGGGYSSIGSLTIPNNGACTLCVNFHVLV